MGDKQTLRAQCALAAIGLAAMWTAPPATAQMLSESSVSQHKSLEPSLSDLLRKNLAQDPFGAEGPRLDARGMATIEFGDPNYVPARELWIGAGKPDPGRGPIQFRWREPEEDAPRTGGLRRFIDDTHAITPPDTTPLTGSNMPRLSMRAPRTIQLTDERGAPTGGCSQTLPQVARLGRNLEAELMQAGDLAPNILRDCYGVSGSRGAGGPAQPSSAGEADPLDAMLERSVVIFDAASQKRGGHCTGFLLDDDTVLTAAHCFDRRADTPALTTIAMRCDGFRVWIGPARKRDDEGRPIAAIRHQGAAPTRAAGCPTTEFSRADLGSDVVFAQLGPRASGAPAARYADDASAVRLFAEAGGDATVLRVIGRQPFTWVDGPRLVVTRTSACRLLLDPAQEEGRVLHQCFSWAGMSGGPIFALDAQGAPHLIGVHQAGVMVNNRCATAFEAAEWCKRRTDLPFFNAGHQVDYAAAQP